MGDTEDLSGRTLGEFVLRARLDEGGFGAVYRCDQPTLGREAVTASPRGDVSIWDLPALPGGDPVRAIQHSDAVTAVAFSSTGYDVVSGGLDGSLLLTPENSEPVQLARLTAAIRALGYLPNRRIVVADAGSQLHMYDAARRNRIGTLDSPDLISVLRWSADGHRPQAFGLSWNRRARRAVPAAAAR